MANRVPRHVKAVATIPQTELVKRSVAQDLAPVPLGQHFKVTPTGLQITGQPTLDDFRVIGDILRTFDRSIQFAIGDWVNAVEQRFGEEASQLVDATGWAEETLRVYRWTAEKVLPENRFIDAGLSYAHHQAVAALLPSEQKHWLNLALGKEAEGPWSVMRLKGALAGAQDLAGTPQAWWVMVKADSEQHQAALVKRLTSDGLICKAHQHHKKERES